MGNACSPGLLPKINEQVQIRRERRARHNVENDGFSVQPAGTHGWNQPNKERIHAYIEEKGSPYISESQLEIRTY